MTRDTKKLLITGLLAVTGVIATTVTAIRAGRKLEKNKGMGLREKVKTYAPPILCASGTIAIMCVQFGMSKRAMDDLNALYSVAITPLIDPHKDRPPVDRACKPFENDFIDSDDEPILFYDSFSDRYFEARTCDVLWAEKELNRRFATWNTPSECQCQCLNDFYDLLGLPRTKKGNEIGWTMDEDYYWIDFYHMKTKSDDGLECYILDAVQVPEDYCGW